MKSLQRRSLVLLNQWICSSCQPRLATGQSQIRGFASSNTQLSGPSKLRRVPESPARTRFAPSPTGNLHLGSIRTALFNYLLARRTGGQFLLRVEDTDQKRTIPGAEERLYKDLKWAGLQWDEGPETGGPYGPYRQSERIDLYVTHLRTLLENQKAYRCFCSAERIDSLNRMRHAKGLPLGYDRKCIDVPIDQATARAEQGEAHVVRFRIPEKYPIYRDIVYGKSGHGESKGKKHQFDEPVYDDPILLKSDGFPTYHFANVVDDKLMKITHVIRGSEWMSSTPLHVALYEAFGWTPPLFGHVPLLVDKNNQKLSKRNFDTDLASFRNRGIFPSSLVNFAALLGWSHQQRNDVMNLKELEAIFDMKFTKGNTIVSFDKLDYLQEQHAQRYINDGGDVLEQIIRDVAVALLEKYGARTISTLIGRRKLRDVIALMLQVRSLPYLSATDFTNRVAIFIEDSYVKNRQSFGCSDPRLLHSLRVAASTLLLTPDENWTRETHRTNLAQLDISPAQSEPETSKRTKAELYHFLRWALLGGATGPSLPETMEILGRPICEARIKEAVLIAKEMENQMSKPQVGIRVAKGEGNSKFQQSEKKEWKEHSLPGSVTPPPEEHRE